MLDSLVRACGACVTSCESCFAAAPKIGNIRPRERPLSLSLSPLPPPPPPPPRFPQGRSTGDLRGNVVSGASLSSPHLVIVVVRTWLFAAEIYCLPHRSIHHGEVFWGDWARSHLHNAAADKSLGSRPLAARWWNDLFCARQFGWEFSQVIAPPPPPPPRGD